MTAVSGCLLKNGAALTGQDFSTASVVTWNNRLYDTNSFHPNNDGKITIPSTHNAKYGIFTACLSLANVAQNSTTRAFLLKNGSSAFTGSAGWSRYSGNNAPVGNGQSTSSMWLQFSSPPVLLATNDFFEVQFLMSDNSVDIQPESSFGVVILDDMAAVSQIVYCYQNVTSTAQDLTTPKNLHFDTNAIDTDNAHSTAAASNDSIIIPSSMNGKLGVFNANALVTLGTSATNNSIAITKNGSLTYNGLGANSGSGGSTTTYIPACQTQPIPLATGDVYKVLIWANDNSTTINSGAPNTIVTLLVYGDNPASFVPARGYIL